MNKTVTILGTAVLPLLFIILSVTSAKAESAGSKKWEFTTGSNISYTSPAIGNDGTIYVGSQDNKVYALNPDGSKKWEFVTGNRVDSSPSIGSDGTIYVGSWDKKLYALNPDGSKKWEFVVEHNIRPAPAIGSDGTIYFGSTDENFYAVNPDGSQKWVFSEVEDVYASAAIGSDGTIYVGSENDIFYALNPDGSKKWEFDVGNEIYSSAAIADDGTIYFGGDDKKVYALNPDGSKKWEYSTGSSIYSSPAIDRNGIIYIGSGDNKLYALNPDGSLKWTFLATDRIKSSPAIGLDGTIYVGSADDRLYAINSDGSKKWEFLTGGDIISSPTIGSDGTVYVGSYDDKLYAIEGASGGLTCSPWPKHRQNAKNTGRYNCVQESPVQESGTSVSIINSCAKTQTLDELGEMYDEWLFTPKSTVNSFNATISPGGAYGVFRISSTEIPTGKVDDLTLMKFFNSTQTVRYIIYAANEPEYTTDGAWWMTDSAGNHMTPEDLTTLGDQYLIYFVVKDNGPNDEDKTLGRITDPVAVGNYEVLTGCVLSPKAGLSHDWAFLGILVVLSLFRSRYRKRTR